MMTLTFETKLRSTPDKVWKKMNTIEGLSSEMWPLAKLTVHHDFKNLNDIYQKADLQKLRCWILLFGIIPIDFTELRLKSLDSEKGFVEQSKMSSMKFWKHVRTLKPLSDSECLVKDEIIFEPRRFKKISQAMIKIFFNHRHRNLPKIYDSLI